MPITWGSISKDDFRSDFFAGAAAECLRNGAPVHESSADSGLNSRPEPAESPIEHHCQICPTCGNRLYGHRCKLVCAQCGYYLSCADYY